MALPKDVQSAVAAADAAVVGCDDTIGVRQWRIIRAHLLSQDAEIADLIGKRDFLLRHYNLAESRLAAANALLRFMRTRFNACMDDSDRASIDAHLSENTHG